MSNLTNEPALQKKHMPRIKEFESFSNDGIEAYLNEAAITLLFATF